MTFLRDIQKGVKNLIRWFLVIWKDRDWDHWYFHTMIRQKLSNMEKYLREGGMHVDAKRDADNIKLCIILLDRILKDDYHDIAYINHDKKWGTSHFHWTDVKNKPDLSELQITRDNIITEKDKEQERKEFQRIALQEDKLRKQDIDYLYNTFRKYILNWWD